MNTVTPLLCSPSTLRQRYATIPAPAQVQRYDVAVAWLTLNPTGNPIASNSILPIEATSRSRALRAAEKAIEEAYENSVVTSTVIL